MLRIWGRDQKIWYSKQSSNKCWYVQKIQRDWSALTCNHLWCEPDWLQLVINGPIASSTSWDIWLSWPRKPSQDTFLGELLLLATLESWLSIHVWQHLSSLQRMKQDCLSAETTSIATILRQNISFERTLGLATSEPELIKISLPSTISKRTQIQHRYS